MLAVAVAFGGSAAGVTAASPAKAQIIKTWTTFFAGTTPAATKITLLQNGTRFAAVIRAQASSSLAQQTKAKVKSVTLLGSTKAKVVYTITIAGAPALTNQVGLAVKVKGKWLVSAKSFCALLRLQGGAPPACNGV
jgi:hypothetical protein